MLLIRKAYVAVLTVGRMPGKQKSVGPSDPKPPLELNGLHLVQPRNQYHSTKDFGYFTRVEEGHPELDCPRFVAKSNISCSMSDTVILWYTNAPVDINDGGGS